MKKLIALLLSLLMICGMSITAFAQETTITTTVPDSHSIIVTADGAEVFCAGQSGTQFTVDKLSEPVLLIRADSGREITQVLLNGEDITGEVRGGYYTLGPVYEDKTLTVVTENAPEAGDRTYTVQGTVRRNGQPAPNITVELRSTLKTDITDSDGRFSFSEVLSGKHSLTAIENGEIVGYVEFVLADGAAVNLSLSDGIYTVTTSGNEIGIDLALELTEDGVMTIEAVTGIQAEQKPDGGSQGGNTNPSSPQTGDASHIWLWFMLLILSCAGLMGTIIYNRKKREV